MRDIEKQAVYKQIKDGHRTIEGLTCQQLRDLKEHWFDDKYKAMPPIDFDIRIRNEIRRREVQSATKPMKPIDKNFFR